MSNEGILSQKIMKLVQLNAKELSALSGNLLSASPKKEFRSVLVTSANDKEGKTLAAISMAHLLATQADSKVVMIDANFHAPMIHDNFSVDLEPGLSDILQGNTSFDHVLRKTEFNNLMVIPGGSSFTGTISFQKIETFKSVLTDLSDNFDYIIVDGNSVLGSSSVSLIAKLFHGVIFVIEAEKTRWEVLQQAKDIITNTGGEVKGCVLNRRQYYIPGVVYGNI